MKFSLTFKGKMLFNMPVLFLVKDNNITFIVCYT